MSAGPPRTSLPGAAATILLLGGKINTDAQIFSAFHPSRCHYNSRRLPNLNNPPEFSGLLDGEMARYGIAASRVG